MMSGVVEMQPKGSSSVVVAVPVCRPARPTRAHPSLAVLIMHDVQAYFGMETPLRGRSGGYTGTAPTIPNTHRRSAKVKIKVLMLA